MKTHKMFFMTQLKTSMKLSCDVKDTCDVSHDCKWLYVDDMKLDEIGWIKKFNLVRWYYDHGFRGH